MDYVLPYFIFVPLHSVNPNSVNMRLWTSLDHWWFSPCRYLFNQYIYS